MRSAARMGVLFSGIAVAAAALLLVLWVHGAPAAEALLNDTDGDGVVDAAETIAGSDPANVASTPESAGGSVFLGRPLCTDGADNDLDGMTDGADPGCVDTDLDFVDDPIEQALGSDPANALSIPEHSLLDAVLVSMGFASLQCTDGLDNDVDGLVDGADPGCSPIDGDDDGFDDVGEKLSGSDPADPASVPEGEAANPGSCSDGRDNDADGDVDGADAGCAPATPTPTPTPPATGGPAAGPSATVAALPITGAGGQGTPGEVLDAGVALALAGGAGLAGAGYCLLRLGPHRREEG